MWETDIPNINYIVDVPINTEHILPKTIIVKKDCQEEILDKFENMLKNRKIKIYPTSDKYYNLGYDEFLN